MAWPLFTGEYDIYNDEMKKRLHLSIDWENETVEFRFVELDKTDLEIQQEE